MLFILEQDKTPMLHWRLFSAAFFLREKYQLASYLWVLFVYMNILFTFHTSNRRSGICCGGDGRYGHQHGVRSYAAFKYAQTFRLLCSPARAEDLRRQGNASANCPLCSLSGPFSSYPYRSSRQRSFSQIKSRSVVVTISITQM